MWLSDFHSFAISSGVPFEKEGERVYHFLNPELRVRLVALSEAASGIEWERGVTYIFEDRWHSSRGLLEKRLRAHLGQFRSVFARKCEVFVPTPGECTDFLERWHIYGSAKCKYRYALRYEGETVAVSTFSAPRPMMRNGVQVQSYEWVRFASLPDMRISGGMGRLLEAFVREQAPQDIMSYADLEWSDGSVYERLGFERTALVAPVEFIVDPITFERRHMSKMMKNGAVPAPGSIVIRNLGSAKYVRTFMPLLHF